MDKFSDIFRIESTRLQSWDYSWQGWYFVTICTRDGENHFGEIMDDKMHFSAIGMEVQEQWLKTPILRPDMNLILNDFQVMPNHFHGLIEIGRNDFNKHQDPSSAGCRDALQCLSTPQAKREGNETKNQFGPQRKNLASIIRGFKGSVTTFARKNHLLFDWQPRFHDHIVSNQFELQKIKKYIRNNVRNWDKDRFNK